MARSLRVLSAMETKVSPQEGKATVSPQLGSREDCLVLSALSHLFSEDPGPCHGLGGSSTSADPV